VSKVNTDIDIDLPDRTKLLDTLSHIVARIDRDDAYVKHNTGVYFQDIPFDPITGLATLDHKLAEELGYFKIDLLNNSVYNGVEDEVHLMQLSTTEPMWSMLEDVEIVEQLFHLNQHAALVTRLKPKSVPQLAMVLAIIRPGKAHLQQSDWETIEREVWSRPEEGYFFKKSHAFAFATAIVVQMNLMVEKAMLL
jgi:hypothetical protein